MSKPAPGPVYILKSSETGSPFHSLQFHINSEKESLFTSNQDGYLVQWNLKDGRPIRILKVSEECCLHFVILPNGFVTQDKLGVLGLWTMEDTHQNKSFTNKATVETNHVSFCKMLYLPTCDKILISNSTNEIIAFKSETLEACCDVWKTPKNYGQVIALKLASENEFLAIYEYGILVLWRIVNPTQLSDLQVTKGMPMCLDYSEKCQVGVCGSSDDIIISFRKSANNILTSYKKIVITNAGTSCLRIRQDGKVFAAGCWDFSIRIFTIKRMSLLVVLKYHEGVILDLTFSNFTSTYFSEKSLVAASSADGLITLWDVYGENKCL